MRDWLEEAPADVHSIKEWPNRGRTLTRLSSQMEELLPTIQRFRRIGESEDRSLTLDSRIIEKRRKTQGIRFVRMYASFFHRRLQGILSG